MKLTNPFRKVLRMKKKSLLIIALIIIMTFASLMVACGSREEPAADTDKRTTVSTQAVEPTEAVSEEADETESTKATESVKATEATKAKITSDKKKEPETSAKAPTKQPTKATEAKKVCYITVDGYCSSKQIQLKGGESVYDILKESGASVSARNTGYGLYIEGINGRFEFDEGPTSGWIYTVNGTRPSTSCSNYEVKSGDKIVWTYVLEV